MTFDFSASRESEIAALDVVTRAFFATIGKFPRLLGGSEQSTSNPNNAFHVISSRDYFELRRQLRDVSDRLSRLESIQGVLKRAEPLAVVAGGAESDIPKLRTTCTAAVPAITAAFAQAFEGIDPVVSITASAPDAEFPVTVVVDASDADPTVTARARASGARSKFYRKLASALPPALLDSVEFEFVFPSDAA